MPRTRPGWLEKPGLRERGRLVMASLDWTARAALGLLSSSVRLADSNPGSQTEKTIGKNWRGSTSVVYETESQCWWLTENVRTWETSTRPGLGPPAYPIHEVVPVRHIRLFRAHASLKKGTRLWGYCLTIVVSSLGAPHVERRMRLLDPCTKERDYLFSCDRKRIFRIWRRQRCFPPFDSGFGLSDHLSPPVPSFISLRRKSSDEELRIQACVGWRHARQPWICVGTWTLKSLDGNTVSLLCEELVGFTVKCAQHPVKVQYMMYCR